MKRSISTDDRAYLQELITLVRALDRSAGLLVAEAEGITGDGGDNSLTFDVAHNTDDGVDDLLRRLGVRVRPDEDFPPVSSSPSATAEPGV